MEEEVQFIAMMKTLRCSTAWSDLRQGKSIFIAPGGGQRLTCTRSRNSRGGSEGGRREPG